MEDEECKHCDRETTMVLAYNLRFRLQDEAGDTLDVNVDQNVRVCLGPFLFADVS